MQENSAADLTFFWLTNIMMGGSIPPFNISNSFFLLLKNIHQSLLMEGARCLLFNFYVACFYGSPLPTEKIWLVLKSTWSCVLHVGFTTNKVVKWHWMWTFYFFLTVQELRSFKLILEKVITNDKWKPWNRLSNEDLAKQLSKKKPHNFYFNIYNLLVGVLFSKSN